MKISREDAIKILISITNKEDAEWEILTEHLCEDDDDPLPGFIDVLGAVGITKDEIKAAEGLI